jgi:hypothetical protein
VLASIPEREPAAVGALTVRAYALRHEEVRASFRDEMARGLAAGATWMDAVFSADDLPMPAETMVRVINALIEGLLFQRFLTPELMPDDVFYAAFAALAGKSSSVDDRVSRDRCESISPTTPLSAPTEPFGPGSYRNVIPRGGGMTPLTALLTAARSPLAARRRAHPIRRRLPRTL